jgi:peptidoglycan hydrolase FlgJ
MSLSTNQVAMDARGLDELKRAAGQSPDKALRAAATQFEALFMNMILKGMRESLPKDGLMSSSAGDTFTGMLDQQMSQTLAGKGRGTGLADMLVKQLSRNIRGSDAPAPLTDAARIPLAAGANASTTVSAPAASNIRTGIINRLPLPFPATAAASGTDAALTSAPAAQPPVAGRVAVGVNAIKREFVERMAAHAKEAEQKTGVPAKFMIGQAALESGWGKHEIKHPDGQPAFNLFGVKATGNWSGPTVNVTTTEFVNGVAKKIVEKFRAYASYAEGFADYAKVMGDNPRYAGVMKAAGNGVSSFAHGLQRAGYATDPAYAAKLTSVINETIKFNRQA